MLYSRFLLPENIKQGATVSPLTDEPLRRYLGLNNLATGGVNLHPIVADYFKNMIFDDKPEGADDSVVSSLKNSCFWRALYGFGVVLQQGSRTLDINPRFWWPILVSGVKVGSIIIYPYTVKPVTGSLMSFGNNDRAWVVVAIDADPRAEVSIWEWSGVSLGLKLSEEVVSPVKVAVWGDGVSEFNRAGEWSLDEIARRSVGISNILKRFEKPHLQAPASAISFREDGTPALKLDQDGSVLPIQKDDKDWKYVTLTEENPLHEFQHNMILSSISSNTSIPPADLGLIRSSRAETGNALSVENHITAAKARLWRNDITQAALDLGYNLNWPSLLLSENNGAITNENSETPN